jgi:hypothetical protein
MLLVAHRHFIEEDPEHPLTPEMRMEFSEIEMRATHMYNDRYHVSDECRKLGAMVKTAPKINTTSLRSVSIASTSSSASLKSTGKRRRNADDYEPSTPSSKRSRFVALSSHDHCPVLIDLQLRRERPLLAVAVPI